MMPLLSTCLGRGRLGVGRVDITPPPDAYHRNWGAALHDAAEGIHRALVATVLVLSDDDTGEQVRALFTVDLGWLRYREMDVLLGHLRDGTGLGDDDLVFTFSHTHAAINLPLATPLPGQNTSWSDTLHQWVATCDHKKLGVMYVCSGLFFFVVAGIEAALMRYQLFFAGNDAINPETFNRLFTMHGTTMVFMVGIMIASWL